MGFCISPPELACLDEQRLSDRICVRPQLRRQNLIDDDRLPARLEIAGIERPAPDDWNGQRLEESRPDDMVRNPDRFLRR